MKKVKLALIGKDVSKSLSPQIHFFIANRLGVEIEYEKISIKEEEFENTIDGILNSCDGLNVTIPYKLSIIPKLKKLCGDAEIFGAVNTVKISELSGHNTDGDGFMLMLKNGGIEVKGRKVLLLGAGGAGRSVAKKLSDGGAEVYVYDKNAESAIAVSEEFKGVNKLENLDGEYFAVINATGVGMHKSVGTSPVGKEILNSCSVAVDLIYNPAKSRFLEIAEECGKKIMNGKAMLFYQAYFSDCIYFGLKPDEVLAKKLFEEFLSEGL